MISTKPVNIQDIIAEWCDLDRDKKPSPEITFADDPIALSWASYHVWKKTPGRRWVDLKDVEAHAHDREMAATTRRYYRDRYTMQALKGRQLTEFQTTLYGIVGGEQPILQDQVGVIMKIPYFYVEDITLDHVFSTTRAVKRDLADRLVNIRDEVIIPYEYIFASRKRQETHQYWFTDSRGHPVLWPVGTNNPLASLVRSLYLRQSPLRIRATWHWANMRGPHHGNTHWLINNVEMV